MSVSYIYQLEIENKRLKEQLKLLLHDQIKHIKMIEGLAQNRNKLEEKLTHFFVKISKTKEKCSMCDQYRKIKNENS